MYVVADQSPDKMISSLPSSARLTPSPSRVRILDVGGELPSATTHGQFPDPSLWAVHFVGGALVGVLLAESGGDR